MSNQPNPQIYVACLASYNSGALHGEWIDAAQDEDELARKIEEMLANSPEPNAEEWAVHDHEDFGGIEVREDCPLEKISAIACAIEELGEAFCKWYESEADLNTESFQSAYLGWYESIKAYIEERVVPEELKTSKLLWGTVNMYLDYESIQKDLECDGVRFAPGDLGGYYVFQW